MKSSLILSYSSELFLFILSFLVVVVGGKKRIVSEGGGRSAGN